LCTKSPIDDILISSTLSIGERPLKLASRQL
jgi:hypothetical protein